MTKNTKKITRVPSSIKDTKTSIPEDIKDALAEKYVSGASDAKPEPSEAATFKPPESIPSTKPEISSNPKRKGVIRGNREQISLTVPPEVLTELEAMAKRRGMTRSGLINQTLRQLIGLES